eukprot:scaffold20.g7773.t1
MAFLQAAKRLAETVVQEARELKASALSAACGVVQLAGGADKARGSTRASSAATSPRGSTTSTPALSASASLTAAELAVAAAAPQQHAAHAGAGYVPAHADGQHHRPSWLPTPAPAPWPRATSSDGPASHPGEQQHAAGASAPGSPARAVQQPAAAPAPLVPLAHNPLCGTVSPDNAGDVRQQQQLEQAERDLAELRAARARDQATLAEVDEQLAQLKQAAAAADEERAAAARLRWQLHELQQEEHALADLRSQVDQLQEALAVEQAGHCSTRAELGVAQEQAASMEQGWYEEQQQVEALRRRLADEEAAGEEANSALAGRDAFWQQQVAGLRDELAVQAAGHAAAVAALEARLREQAAEHAQAVAVGQEGGVSAVQEHLATLQAQLRESWDELAAERQRAANMQQELASAQAALEQAHAVASSDDAAAALEAELAQARTECARLRAEADRLRQQGNQQGAASSDGGAAAEAATGPQQRVAELESALEAAEADKAAARQQLGRLKQQMLREQEDEEEKIRWRVEAEVKLAVERLQRIGAAPGAGPELARALEEAAAARQRVKQLEADMAKWEAAVAERDAELQNLQRALGELSYESDAGALGRLTHPHAARTERLRGEMRALQAEAHSLRDALDTEHLAQLRLEQAREAAEGAAAAAAAQVASAREAEGRAAAEVLGLRGQLAEAQRRLAAATTDSGTMIDRRIVVKMLITYFERNHSPEVLDLMASMLSFTEEEKARIQASQRRRGGRKATSLASDVQHANGGAPASLADAWLDFLEEAAAAPDRPSGQPQQPQRGASDAGQAGVLGVAAPPLTGSAHSSGSLSSIPNPFSAA